MVAGEHSGDALGRPADGRAQRAAARTHPLSRRRRRAHGRRRGWSRSFRIERCGGDGHRRHPGRAAEAAAPRVRHGRAQLSPPSPTRSSSSTAPSSRIRSRGASASGGRRSRSSTTCRPACGRGGRAARAKMREYVDHVLALLPFEPDAHQRLRGPPCTYVGHPLIERRAWIQALDPEPLADACSCSPTARCCWCCRAAAPPRCGA